MARSRRDQGCALMCPAMRWLDAHAAGKAALSVRQLQPTVGLSQPDGRLRRRAGRSSSGRDPGVRALDFETDFASCSTVHVPGRAALQGPILLMGPAGPVKAFWAAQEARRESKQQQRPRVCLSVPRRLQVKPCLAGDHLIGRKS